MKKKKLVLCLAALALIAAAWWWTGPRHALNGPPRLTVSAGREETQVGYWSADWVSLTTAFSACGPSPTDPAARSDQPVIYAAEGTDTLTLSYPAAPSRMAVFCTSDSGGETVCLYDGWGRRKLTIPLSEDFRGIYEVSEDWRTVPPASGSAQRGFLVVGEGESAGDPKLAEPPALTVVTEDGTELTARLGSYSWCVWLGGEEMECTIADCASPLELPDLPTLSARTGERLELQFTVPADEISVWAWPVEKGVDQEPVQVALLPGGNDLPVPELEGAAVLEVRGGWSLAGNAGGEVSYLFEIA